MHPAGSSAAAELHPLLSVTPRAAGRSGHVVVEAVGEVDSFTVPLLRACLGTQLTRPELRALTVDMGGVAFLGAAGVSVLVEAGRRCRNRGVRFTLRWHGRRPVLRPLQLTGATDVLDADSPAPRAHVPRTPRVPSGRRTAARRGTRAPVRGGGR